MATEVVWWSSAENIPLVEDIPFFPNETLGLRSSNVEAALEGKTFFVSKLEVA